jgi:hypothetical protein
MPPVYPNLEDVLPDFYDGGLDQVYADTFEDDFLKPRLKARHPEATAIRFCGGRQNYETGAYTNRTVQVWRGTSLIKTYKYGRQ